MAGHMDGRGPGPDLIERAGGERMVERLADACFVEMIPDHRLARLFKGQREARIVTHQRDILRALLTGDVEGREDLATLFAPESTGPVHPRQLRAMADILMDCMVEAAMPTDVILAVLDRLDHVHPGILPESAAAWDLGWAPRRALFGTAVTAGAGIE